MRGRKPKPTHLKLVTGNPGKRALKADAVQPAQKATVPRPPEYLCLLGKAEWRRVAAALHAQRVLTDIDRTALAAYCQAYATWRLASAALKRAAQKDPETHGLVFLTDKGNAIQNPLVGIANKAAADMVRFAAEFGMTPSARSRLDIGRAEERDPTDRFFN